MKKVIVFAAIMLLPCLGAQALGSGGMMSGGMMGRGMMGGGMGNPGQAGESHASPTDSSGAGIFRTSCASCHFNGGNVVAPNLPLKGSRMLVDFETFLGFIRHPRMPDGSKGAMPAFTKAEIADRQAEILYQFITATNGTGRSRN